MSLWSSWSWDGKIDERRSKRKHIVFLSCSFARSDHQIIERSTTENTRHISFFVHVYHRFATTNAVVGLNEKKNRNFFCWLYVSMRNCLSHSNANELERMCTLAVFDTAMMSFTFLSFAATFCPFARRRLVVLLLVFLYGRSSLV